MSSIQRKRINSSQKWETYLINAKHYYRIKFGDETIRQRYTDDGLCICGIVKGQLHVLGCYSEQCPVCLEHCVNCRCESFEVENE